MKRSALLSLSLGLLTLGKLTAPALAEEPAAPSSPPKPLTYESLKAWHEAGGLKSYFWPKEHRVDLNGDGEPEVLLGTLGYSRGMSYALFTQKGGAWVLVGENIEGSHHEPQAAQQEHDGWRDLETLQADGRGAVNQLTYRWENGSYRLKDSRKVAIKPD